LFHYEQDKREDKKAIRDLSLVEIIRYPENRNITKKGSLYSENEH